MEKAMEEEDFYKRELKRCRFRDVPSWQCILLNFLPAFPTTNIKTPETHTGVQEHSYCWNCPTPLTPTILLDMPGFFEVVFRH